MKIDSKILRFLVLLLVIFFLLPLTACITKCMKIIQDPLVIDINDPCATNLQELKEVKKSYALIDGGKKLTISFASCVTKQMLAGKEMEVAMKSCGKSCGRSSDLKKVINTLTSAFDGEREYLRKVNMAIYRLQNCRDKEARTILSGVKSKNKSRREEAIAKFDNLKERVKNDNKFLENIVKKSGKRIKANEKVAQDIKLIASGVPSKSLRVKPGYNIRNRPEINSEIIGKTQNRRIKIYDITGDWISIQHRSEPAYVSAKAFNSISQKTRVQVTHSNTKKEYEKVKENYREYQGREEKMEKEFNEIIKGHALG